MAATTARLVLFLGFVLVGGQMTESPTYMPTTSPTKVRPTPAPTPPADTAGQVISALIFITLIVLVIAFGINGWRKNKFSELTRINLDQGQTLDEEAPTEIKPDDVALAAAVGPTYFSSDEDSKQERRREVDGEESTVIHVNEGATTDRGLEDMSGSSTHAEKRASVEEESEEARHRAETRKRAEAAAAKAKEAVEKAAEDMRLKQLEEQREAVRREEDAENQRRAQLLAEQAEAEQRAREAELAAAEAAAATAAAEKAAAEKPAPLSEDPFVDLGRELSQGVTEPLSPGDDDAELREAQAALEAAEAEQRAMEAALEAERLAEEEEGLNLS